MTARRRPCVTLKLATSLDGRIALANGVSQWITGEDARAEGHRLRADHDAVVTGVGTVLADDPRLTARPPEGAPARQPLRVVLDSRLRTPEDAALLQPPGEAVIYCLKAAKGRFEAFRGVCKAIEAGADGRVALERVFDDLEARGCGRILIEAGGALAGSALRAGRVDAIEWFRAPILLGGDGRPCVADLGLETLARAPMFERVSVRERGRDLWETYRRREA